MARVLRVRALVELAREKRRRGVPRFSYRGRGKKEGDDRVVGMSAP